MAQLLAIVTVIFATNFAVGRRLGYLDIRSYFSFWMLSALTFVPAWRLAHVTGSRDRASANVAPGAEPLVRAGVYAFAIVVSCALVLGTIGRLSLTSMLIAQLVCALALLTVTRQPRHVEVRMPRTWPSFAVGLVGASLIFIVAYGATHAPFTLYDSISYHLFFAARWVQDRTVAIIPTPFSDEAQAYAPANGELFFAWLMLPFHSDLLARIGQLPFAGLAAAALYAIARRLDAAPQHALYPAGFFLLARPVVEQAGGANVDLICASMFLATMYAGIAASVRNPERVTLQRGAWLFWGVAFGLYCGTKYLALVYAPVLVALALACGPRRHMLWALPGAAAFGAPWYIRNWLLAGSPVYPASLSVAGVTLARGAFTRAAMLNTVFHTTDVRLLPAMLAHAFGPTLALVWLPLAAAGAVRMLQRGVWPWGALALTPLAMTGLYWFGLPVNIDSRFLLPAVGPALLPVAFLFGANRRWNAALHALLAAAMVWIVVGLNAELPARLPWFMAGWLALNGLVEPRFLWLFGATAVLLSAAWRAASKTPRWGVPVIAALCGLSTAVLAAPGERWCPARCDYLDTTPTYIRPNLVAAWQWMSDNVTASTVAYTGINLPYPLTGRQLTNRVVYVNIDGRPSWRFHDYDRAYRARRFDPRPPLLATSSGELLPVPPRNGSRDDALRPRYERMQGIRDAWLDNLRRFRVDYLFVAALSAYEIDYVWHNGGGFPIEDDWARSDPRQFTVVYENPQVKVYRVDKWAGA
jgi:hypothetical protein